MISGALERHANIPRATCEQEKWRWYPLSRQTSWNGDDVPFQFHDCGFAATYNAWQNPTPAMRPVTNVHMKTTMLSDYVPSMCTGQAHNTIAALVRNDYHVWKADSAEPNVSANVRTDRKLYYPNDFGQERDDDSTS